MLGVGDRVTDDVLEEDLEHTAGLLVDETGDTLDTATTSETANGGLGDSLDVIAKDLAVTLGASLSKTFATFSATGHVGLLFEVGKTMRIVFYGEIFLFVGASLESTIDNVDFYANAYQT